jgi:4-hydroxybenzoate polyprenyltransferase
MVWIRALRLPNLLIVLLALAGSRAILMGAYGKFPVPFHFWLLTLTTMLILVGGNLINDYFDQEIDAVNRPDRLLIGTQVSARAALIIYLIINALALGFAAKLASELNWPIWASVLYPGCVVGLFFYSYKLKCTPLLGNLLIALFCGLVPLQMWWLLNEEQVLLPAQMPLRLKAYIVFAFLLTLWREIVKDLEDIKGDAEARCRTLPVATSEKIARNLAIAIGFVLFLLLCGMIHQLIPAKYQIFMLAFLLAPCGAAIRWLWQTGHPIFYKRASTFIKILMVTGLIALIYG